MHTNPNKYSFVHFTLSFYPRLGQIPCHPDLYGHKRQTESHGVSCEYSWNDIRLYILPYHCQNSELLGKKQNGKFTSHPNCIEEFYKQEKKFKVTDRAKLLVILSFATYFIPFQSKILHLHPS